MKMKFFNLAYAFLAFFTLIPTALSFNFGTNLRIGVLDINESGCFEILAWTTDHENVSAIFSVVEKPENWRIEVDPERLEMNRETGSEIILLQEGYARASVVKICSYPSQVSNGTYQIRIKASAYSGSSEMQSTQDRFFVLTANAAGSYKEEKPDNYLDWFLVSASLAILIVLAARRFFK